MMGKRPNDKEHWKAVKESLTKPPRAQRGNDICSICGFKKNGHYYRRISKGGIFEFVCKPCMKKKWDEIILRNYEK